MRRKSPVLVPVGSSIDIESMMEEAAGGRSDRILPMWDVEEASKERPCVSVEDDYSDRSRP